MFCFPPSSICEMDFDIILKFETLREEQNLMLNTLGLADTIKIPTIHENARLLSKEEKLKYFKMLSNEELHTLYGMYRHDFLLFNYGLPNSKWNKTCWSNDEPYGPLKPTWSFVKRWRRRVRLYCLLPAQHVKWWNSLIFDKEIFL